MMALMLAMAGTGAWAQGTVTFKEGTEDAANWTATVGNGTYTVSWTNDTDAAVAWSGGQSSLVMTMQYTGYASLSDTSAAGLKAACEIVNIVIE